MASPWTERVRQITTCSPRHRIGEEQNSLMSSEICLEPSYSFSYEEEI